MIEYTAVAFNVLYVVLATRGSIWCWPMGIIASALSIYLFIGVKIYAEAILASYYVFMGFYGWMQWRNKKAGTLVKIQTWSIKHNLLLVLAGYLGSLILYWPLQKFTDAEMPLLDSYTTVFSFLATWLVAKKVLENWIYWIAIDSLTVYLYLARGLEIYAALSVLYTAIAAYGYVAWRKDLQSSD